MVEARSFVVFTHHKPLTYAFLQKFEKYSPRHLDFLGQFTTDIRYVRGEENTVADALSRMEGINRPIDYPQLAASQENDPELNKYLGKDSILQLRQVVIPDTQTLIYCDFSTSKAHPFITQPFRCSVFEAIHGLSHPGTNATVKLITQRFVWPRIKADCRQWARGCNGCQKAKISRHVINSPGSFISPTSKFSHIHLDIVIMPYCEGFR